MTVTSETASALQLLAAHIDDVRAALDEHGLPGTGASTAELGDLVRSIVRAAPYNVAPPTISGPRRAGSTLSLWTGTWAGAAPVALAIAWYMDGEPVPGATGLTLVTEEEDDGRVVFVRVTATNAHGSASADSDPIVLAAAGVTDVLASSSTLLASSSTLISSLEVS